MDNGVDTVVDVKAVVDVVDTVVDVTTTVVEIFWLLLGLVGGRNSKTKAATMPTPATTARTLAFNDHFLTEVSSSGGWDAGGSSEGGGP